MEKKIKTGIDLSGNIMIFKDKNGNFGTTIGKKTEEGVWENKRIPLTFAGGTPQNLRDRDIISIKGFLSFFVTAKGEEVVTIVVMEHKLNDNLPF